MKGLSLWKPDFLLLLLAFSIFSIFHLSKKKDILKKQHILYPQSRIARPEETMPTFGTRTPGEVHYLGSLHSLHTDTTAFGFMYPEFATGSTWYFWPDYTRFTWLRSHDHYGHPWDIFARWIMEMLFLVISLFFCWSANPLDIYIVFLFISAVYWSCLVFFSFLFILCDRTVFSGLFPTPILNLLEASS